MGTFLSPCAQLCRDKNIPKPWGQKCPSSLSYAMMLFITWPCTSVSRTFLPL